MNQIDDVILEFLNDISDPDGPPVALTPGSIHVNIVEIRAAIDRAPNTVAGRLKKLESNDMVALAEQGGTRYYITDRGRDYLTGEIDRTELID